MTVIVGILRHGTIYMGADSSAVGEWDLSRETKPKVFRRDDWVIGFTGSFRMGQLLEHCLVIPPLEDEPTNAYMVKEFVNAVRECLRDGGLLKKENERESFDSEFLVGCRGRLFRINADFGVSEMQEGYDAIGCGAQIAIGAICAIEQLGEDWDPKRSIETALYAAEKHNIGVRGPMRIIVSDHLHVVPLGPSEVNTATTVASNGA